MTPVMGRVEILRTFDSPAMKPGDLAWDGRALWHVDRQRNLILKLDAETGEVLANFEFTGVASGVAASDRCLWITDISVPLIYCFDLQSLKVVGHLPLPAECHGDGALAFDGESLWQADVSGGQLLRLHLGTGRLEEIVEVDANLTGLSRAGNHLAFCDFGEGCLRQLDIAQKLILTSYALPGEPRSLAWEKEERFWYLDAATGQVCQLRLL